MGIKHDFDLDHPMILHTVLADLKQYGGNGDNKFYTKFHCKNCNKTLALDIEDMMNLPKEMKEGCPVKPIEYWHHAQGIDFCQRQTDRLTFENLRGKKDGNKPR
jgi:hypothetical protein